MFLASYQNTGNEPPKRVNIWSEAQRLKREAEKAAGRAFEAREQERLRRQEAQQRRREDEALLRMRPGHIPLACDVLKVEAAKLGTPVAAITGQGRGKSLVLVRHACIRAVAEARPDLSMTQIGRLFKRDHTTILYVLGRCGRNKVPA